MSTTLTNGLKLPDKGSVDWYADMQNNYAILDGAVGTVAEHTTQIAGKAPAVHTHTKADITDFPVYGNTAGTICEGNDSRLSDARTPVSHSHGSISNDGKLANGNKVVITNANKVITESSVTDTELGYLSGVTSAIQTQISGKANASHTHSASDITSGLATVATSGSYNDLTNKPTIPTVNNATLTIQKNGTSVATFTANSASDVTANITVPTKTSELTNDSGFLTSHQSLSNYSTLANTIKSLSISGKTITYTKGDNTTGTLTTQDTNTDTLMTQNVSTTNATYPILLCPTANATSNQGAKTGIFAKSVKINPSTNALSATQLWSNSQTIQNSGFTKGTNPSSQAFWSMYISDKNGNDWAANCLGVFETTCDTSGNVTSVMKAVKNEANSSSAGAIAVTYNKSANTVSTYAPTPATSDNSTQIATTAFVKAQGYITSSSNITGTSANVTGTVAIANGGTGATSRLNAVKNLTNEDVGTNAQFFLTITTNWGKAGYCSVANAKTVLGLGSAAYTASTAYAAASHTHSYLPLTGGTVTGDIICTGGDIICTSNFVRRHTSLVKGTNPSSKLYLGLKFCDKNGANTANNALGLVETSVGTDGTVSAYITAFKNTASNNSYASKVSCNYDTTKGWINCVGEELQLASGIRTQGTVPTSNQDCYFRMYDSASHVMFQILNRSVANSSNNQTYTTIGVAPNTSGAGVTDAFRIYAQTDNSSTVCNVLTQNFLPISNNTYNLGDNSHRWANIYGINLAVSGTGVCPTQDVSDNTGKIATTAFVKNAIPYIISGGANTSAGNITFFKGTIISGFAESNSVTYSTDFGGILTSPSHLYYATCIYNTSDSTMAFSKGPAVGGTGTWKLMGGGSTNPGTSTKLLFGLWIKIA